MSLALRKAVRDAEPSLKAHLEKLAKVTGVGPWTFEVANIGDIAKAAVAAGRFSAEEQLPDLFYGSDDSLLGNAVECVTKVSFSCFLVVYRALQGCADDMVKEAFLEATKAHKIEFKLEGSTSSPDVKFENGVFIIFQQLSKFPANRGDLSCIKLEKKL